MAHSNIKGIRDSRYAPYTRFSVVRIWNEWFFGLLSHTSMGPDHPHLDRGQLLPTCQKCSPEWGPMHGAPLGDHSFHMGDCPLPYDDGPHFIATNRRLKKPGAACGAYGTMFSTY